MIKNIGLIILVTVVSLSFKFVKNNEIIDKNNLGDKLINELSNSLDDYKCVYDLGYHVSSKITEEDISYHDKAIKISKYFDKENADKVEYESSDNSYLTLYFKKEKFIEKGKELFGDDFLFDIKNGLVDTILGEKIYYDNGYFIKKYYYGGGGCNETFLKKIINYKMENNYIYIYDKYLYIEEDFDNKNQTVLYNSFDKNKIIATSNESIFYNYDGFLEEANTFKHTFKKSKNGNYYWVSSEMIK